MESKKKFHHAHVACRRTRARAAHKQQPAESRGERKEKLEKLVCSERQTLNNIIFISFYHIKVHDSLCWLVVLRSKNGRSLSRIEKFISSPDISALIQSLRALLRVENRVARRRPGSRAAEEKFNGNRLDF